MTTNDAATRYRQDELLRFPRKAAVISAIVAVIGAAVQSFALDTISAPLIGLAIVSAVISLAALSNMIGIPRRAIDRIQRLADEEGGRYSEWKDGTGGHTGIVFAYGARHERFGVLEYVDKGIAVEIGHVASEVSERFRAPAGRRHSYVAMRLPQRMPHMLVDFGVLGRVLGLRIAPGQWHRSQRLALGAWRDLPLYVADGGEAIARKFFTPELVALLKRIGRFYDVEIRGDELYLFSRRSVAYGSDARWAMQRELIDELIDQLAESDVWESVRSDAHAASLNDLRADVTRGVVVVFSVAAVVVVILSVVIVNATGVLD